MRVYLGKIIFILAFLVTGLANAQTTPPFVCAPTFYSVLGNSAPLRSQLNQLDGTFTFNPIGPETTTANVNPATGANFPANFNYNALGYNPLDNYLYAVIDGTNAVAGPFVKNDFIRVDAAGGIESLGIPVGLPTASGDYTSGAFLPDGTFVIGTNDNGATILTLDVSTSPPTLLTQGVLANTRIDDLAVDPNNPALVYSVDQNNPDTVIRFDPADPANTVVRFTNPTGANVNSGSQFVDDSGIFYFINGQGQQLYQVTDLDPVTGGAATLVSTVTTGSAFNRHDGATCINSVSMTKTVNPSTIQAGGIVTYTYQISNQSTASATLSGAFVDLLPNDGRTFIPGTETLSNMTGTVSFNSPTNTQMDIAAFGIAANSSGQIQVQVQIPTDMAPGIYNNQSQISGLPTGFPQTPVVSDYPPTATVGDPTPVTVTANPVIGVAKNLSSVTPLGNGVFTVAIQLTVENLGNVDLSDLVVIDDIVGQFAGLNPTGLTATNGTLTANPGWNGTSGSNILSAGQNLLVGASGTVNISFQVTPGATASVNNTATAQGTPPTGPAATDTSTDGLDPDPSGDNVPDELVPTPVPFPPVAANPVIGIAKNLSSVTPLGNGVFSVAIQLTVENLGNVDLSDLVIFDDIVGQFAAVSPAGFTATNGTLTANPGWNGTSGSNILAAGQNLLVGASGTVNISFQVTPGATTSIDNTATAQGTPPTGPAATDTSTDGLDPDPSGDNVPDELIPTPVPFPPVAANPVIGIAKNLSSVTSLGNGVFSVAIQLTVENLGNVDLSDLVIVDDVVGQFAAVSPAGFTATNGTLTANPGWNGSSGINILSAGQSLLVGASGTVNISFQVTPGTTTSIDNTATAQGTPPTGPAVTDTSTDGLDPDPSGDNIPNELIPTPVPFPPVAATPVIGVAKSLSSVAPLGNGVFSVAIQLTVENLGNVDLSDIVIFDNVVGQFAGLNPTGFAATSGTLTANPGWNGTSGSNILAAGQSLLAGASGTVNISFQVTPNATASVNNTATAQGTPPTGPAVTDTSTDGLDPDPSGDNIPNELTPTPVPFPPVAATPVIGVAKSLSSVTPLGNGVFTVAIQLTVENLGNVDLSNLVIIDDIVGQFAGLNPTDFTATNGTLTANPGWNGTSGSNILNAGQSLLAGASGTVNISFQVAPNATASVNNTASAQGTPPTGPAVTDTSTDGLDPDPSGDNIPDELIPTPVPFPPVATNPVIGIAKNLNSVTPIGNDVFTVAIQLTVENLGNVDLSDLVIVDDIVGQFAGLNPTGFTATNGTLTANPGWNGTSGSNILSAGQSLLVGASETVNISFQVTPGTTASIDNIATAQGTPPTGAPVVDRSTDGLSSDSNGDNIPDENVPTPVPFPPLAAIPTLDFWAMAGLLVMLILLGGRTLRRYPGNIQ